MKVSSDVILAFIIDLNIRTKASYGISMTAHCKWTTKVFRSKSLTFLMAQYIALISQTTLMISIMLFFLVWIWILILALS